MLNKRISLPMILAISLLCLNQKSYGEETTSKLFFSLYAEGGLALSSYRSSDASLDPQFSSVLGPALGVGANMRFLKASGQNRFSAKDGVLAVQAGLLYTRSGYKADEKVTGNYICVPLSFQYYPLYGHIKPKNGDLFVEVDMEMHMNVGLSPSSVSIQGLNLDLDKHKANDFKIGFGAGYMHKFEKFGPIGISLKYLFGTSDFAENLPWKSNQFRMSVFYRFGL